MKYLRIPWGMRAMKEPGLTPALCHPDHTMLFPAEKMPEIGRASCRERV